MKITFYQIGKTTEAYIQAGENEFIKRIKRYNSFDTNVLPVPKNASKYSFSEQKQLEGEKILKVLAPTDFVVLLDEGGREFTSRKFSSFIEQRMNAATRNLVFIVGGAYGFSDDVYKRANQKISLSKMTFPHQLVRVIFLEQLYRAFTIMRNEPYHHD